MQIVASCASWTNCRSSPVLTSSWPATTGERHRASSTCAQSTPMRWPTSKATFSAQCSPVCGLGNFRSHRSASPTNRIQIFLALLVSHECPTCPRFLRRCRAHPPSLSRLARFCACGYRRIVAQIVHWRERAHFLPCFAGVSSTRNAVSTRRVFGRCIAIPSQQAASSRSITSIPSARCCVTTLLRAAGYRSSGW